MTSKSIRRTRKIKSILIIAAIGTIVGSIFTGIAFGFEPVRILKGAIGGFFITFLIGLIESFIFQNKFRKLKFSTGLFFRTLLYVLVISLTVILVWVIHESSVNNTDYFTTLKSDDFRHFIFEGDFKSILLFAVVVGFLINFFTQINSLLGKNVLLNYLTGRYHTPKKEQRVFMFLDLTSSTTIAEKLGPVTYHKFINNYFFDIDLPIVESKGEVYQYVGDEVVVSWRDDKGFENANCINCFFGIIERIEDLKEKYSRDFDVIPEFKAGVHCGNVVIGEIGDSKKEIAFHGDVLNTAARIMSECNSLKKKFLISEDVLKKIKLPQEFKSISMGKFLLRGKENETELYSIEKNI